MRRSNERDKREKKKRGKRKKENRIESWVNICKHKSWWKKNKMRIKDERKSLKKLDIFERTKDWTDLLNVYIKRSKIFRKLVHDEIIDEKSRFFFKVKRQKKNIIKKKGKSRLKRRKIVRKWSWNRKKWKKGKK